MRIDFLDLGEDFTFQNIAPAGWSLGELCAGITCACLPTLRPLLFRVVSPKLSRRKTSMINLLRSSSVQLKPKSSSSSEAPSKINEHRLETALETVDEEAGEVSSAASLAGSQGSEDRSQIFRNVM